MALNFSGNKFNIYHSLAKPSLPKSHYLSFINKFRKLNILEDYLSFNAKINDDNVNIRLAAVKDLCRLMAQRKLAKPRNTVRLELALTQNFNEQTKAEQLKIIEAFRQLSFNSSFMVRYYLKQLNLVEVAETGYKQLIYDDYVKLSNYKNATLLVLAAFKQGLSKFTIAAAGLSHKEALGEALEVAALLKLEVNLALQFNLREEGRQVSYLAVLPYLAGAQQFYHYLTLNDLALQRFFNELQNDEQRQLAYLKKSIERFNRLFLPNFNEGYSGEPFCQLAPLSSEKLLTANAGAISLAEELAGNYRTIVKRRLLFMEERLMNTGNSHSHWDYASLQGRLRELKTNLAAIDSKQLAKEYFIAKSYDELYAPLMSLRKLAPALHKAGLNVRLLNPLQLAGAWQFIEKNSGFIDELELFYAAGENSLDDLAELSQKITAYNETAAKPFKLCCGSGGEELGFTAEGNLSNKDKKLRRALPPFTGNLINPKAGTIYSLASIKDKSKRPVTLNPIFYGLNLLAHTINSPLRNIINLKKTLKFWQANFTVMLNEQGNKYLNTLDALYLYSYNNLARLAFKRQDKPSLVSWHNLLAGYHNRTENSKMLAFIILNYNHEEAGYLVKLFAGRGKMLNYLNLQVKDDGELPK